jgi:tetratricopeptide (TPR) repeat protein
MHPATAVSLNNLATLLQAQGDYNAARPYFERALQIREQALGPEHPDTAHSLNSLAGLLYAQADYNAARPYLERALQINENVFGPEHPDTIPILNNLGALLRAQGEYNAARPYYERALEICVARLGADHPTTRTVQAKLTSGNLLPPTREQQIAEITQHAEAAVAEAFAERTPADRAALAAQLEEAARRIEDGEEPDSLYLALAARLRALAAQLQG